MGPTNLSKSVLATPQNEASSSGLATTPSSASVILNRLKFDEVVDRNKSQVLLKEGHNKRLKMLRKELDYLQDTAWKYQSVDTFIGH